VSAAIASIGKKALHGGQFVRDDGALVHVVPTGDPKRVLFVASDGSTKLRARSKDDELADESSFLQQSVEKFRRIAKRPELSPQLSAVILDVKDVLSRCMRFGESWHAPTIAAWIVGTHMHRLFDPFGYLHVVSSAKGHGKTRLLSLIAALSFNGPKTADVDPSAASLFFDCHRNSATQLIDEVDELWNDNQPRTCSEYCGAGSARVLPCRGELARITARTCATKCFRPRHSRVRASYPTCCGTAQSASSW
jgi:hypothetical protein